MTVIWKSSDDLLSTVGFGLRGTSDRFSKHNHNKDYRNAQSNTEKRVNNTDFSEHTLVTGFKPIRDRYLINSFGRMTAPILQMFPELEGYTAAVPSKRDLQALMKALQGELITAVVEGHQGLVGLICKEFLKAIKVMMTKIEGMVINTAETRKISSQNNFQRTSQQEHNSQLFVLLLQFKEALQKIPQQVLKSASENANNSNNATIDSNILQEMERAVTTATNSIDELANKQILDSIVALLSGYIKSVLTSLHKEGVTSLNTTKNNPNSTEDCSAAVLTLSKQVPIMLKSYITACLPKCDIVDKAVEEICIRLMNLYVSIASLCRPMSEALRLRTAKDMSTIEVFLSSIYTIPNPQNCPVCLEFRAFRRLLFMDGATTTGKEKVKSFSATVPPSRALLMQLPYVLNLRPSTILGYLISCAPSQLPSPYDLEDNTLMLYLSELTDVMIDGKDLPVDINSHIYTVRSLYSIVTNNNNQSLGSWSKVENEIKAWALIQQSLDIFFQRLSVAEGNQKQQMRAWYEAMIDIGTQYFGIMR